MTFQTHTTAAPTRAAARLHGRAERAEAGVEANSRLTVLTGMVLLVLFAVEGFTLLGIHQMITVHIVVGALLIGPVLLKTVSTGYRFARYYTGASPYVRKGPPHPVLRALGPAVVLTSLAVLGTGVGLAYLTPDNRGTLLFWHQASFFLWFAVMTVHVLGHIVEGLRGTVAEVRRPDGDPLARVGGVLGSRSLRLAVVVLALAVGVGAAAIVLPAASAWTGHDFAGFSRFDH